MREKDWTDGIVLVSKAKVGYLVYVGAEGIFRPYPGYLAASVKLNGTDTLRYSPTSKGSSAATISDCSRTHNSWTENGGARSMAARVDRMSVITAPISYYD